MLLTDTDCRVPWCQQMPSRHLFVQDWEGDNSFRISAFLLASTCIAGSSTKSRCWMKAILRNLASIGTAHTAWAGFSALLFHDGAGGCYWPFLSAIPGTFGIGEKTGTAGEECWDPGWQATFQANLPSELQPPIRGAVQWKKTSGQAGKGKVSEKLRSRWGIPAWPYMTYIIMLWSIHKF